MTAITFEKDYKKLQNRLENLEKLVKAIINDELTPKVINKLGKISERLDLGFGRRFNSSRAFDRYLKSL